jgi:hypothetical protein
VIVTGPAEYRAGPVRIHEVISGTAIDSGRAGCSDDDVVSRTAFNQSRRAVGDDEIVARRSQDLGTWIIGLSEYPDFTTGCLSGGKN